MRTNNVELLDAGMAKSAPFPGLDSPGAPAATAMASTGEQTLDLFHRQRQRCIADGQDKPMPYHRACRQEPAGASLWILDAAQEIN